MDKNIKVDDETATKEKVLKPIGEIIFQKEGESKDDYDFYMPRQNG
jgi:hypothetical protein